MGEHYCNHCGRQLTGEELVCPTCGAAIAPPADRTSPTQIVPADDRVGALENPPAIADGALLVVRTGPIAGSQFWLGEGRHSIGRAPESRIVLDDVTVSRRHAEIDATALRYVLRDCGSLNGTYVNGERIEEAVLAHGDDVMIGRFRLVFLTAR